MSCMSVAVTMVIGQGFVIDPGPFSVFGLNGGKENGSHVRREKQQRYSLLPNKDSFVIIQ